MYPTRRIVVVATAVVASVLLAGCAPAPPTTCVPTEPEPTPAEISGVTPSGIVFLRTPDAAFAGIGDQGGLLRSIDVDGLRMAYVEAGPVTGPTVLMLHGEPTWSYMYRESIAALADAGYHVVAPDLIGFGRSDKPADSSVHTYSAHVQWLAEFVADLNLSDVNLIVHDWGGLLGLRLAAENPERFSTLTVTNTALPTVTRPQPSQCPELPAGTPVVFTSFEAWQSYSQRVLELPVADVVEEGTATALSSIERTAYDAPYPSEAYKAGPRTLPALAFSEPGQNQAAWAVLETWTKPTQVIWAPEDPVLGGAASQFQTRIPGTAGRPVINITNASHFLFEDQPTAVTAAILGFLTQVSPP